MPDDDDDFPNPPRGAIFLIAGLTLALARYFGDRAFVWLVYGAGAITQGVHVVNTLSLSNGVQLSPGLRLLHFSIIGVLWIAGAYPVIRLTGFIYWQREEARWASVTWRILSAFGWFSAVAIVATMLWGSR